MNIIRNYTKPAIILEAFLEEHNLAILMRREKSSPREHSACVENYGVLKGALILHTNGRGATEHESLVNLCNLLSGRRLAPCTHMARGAVIQVPELIHILEPERTEVEPLKCPNPSCYLRTVSNGDTVRLIQHGVGGKYLQYQCDICGLSGPWGTDKATAKTRFSRLKMDRTQTP